MKESGQNLGLAIATLCEEWGKTDGNPVYYLAEDLDRRRAEHIQRQRMLRSAQALYRRAEALYIGSQKTLLAALPVNNTLSLWRTSAELVHEFKGQGLTVSKLRYYVKQGLIPKPIRVGQGGKALYSPTTRYRLQFIYTCKGMGNTLADIKSSIEDALSSIIHQADDPAKKAILALIDRQVA